MEFVDALRKMAILDPEYVGALLRGADCRLAPHLDAKTLALARIAALAGSHAPTSKHAFAVEVDAATGAGATPDEIVGVLAGIAPIIGSAALATAAPYLALALGYDTDLALE